MVGVVYDVGGLGDGGVNDLAFAALSRAEDRLGLSVEGIEPDGSGSDRTDLVRSLAGDRTGLVVALGHGARAAVDEVAEERPELRFVVVDDGVSSLPNVTSVVFAVEQGAYLAGAAAALASPAKRIAFAGGTDHETTPRYQAGYTAGARAVDPSMRVDVAYLPPGAEGVPIDPEAAADLALSQLAGGADVIFGAPRDMAAALLSAAAERGLGARAIGIDTDAMETADPGLRGAILASMLKRVDVVLGDVLKRFADGRLPSGALRFDLAHDGVDLAVGGGPLPADALARIDDLRTQIVSGQVQVPIAP